MKRIQLIIYSHPGQVEVYANFRRKDGGTYTYACIIDTGAAISLLPEELLDQLEYRVSANGEFEIEQAGIAQQAFKAVEAWIKVSFEDSTGERTEEFEILAWFTNTTKYLIGFSGVLDRAIFHLDMPALSGYLEFPA